MNPLHIYIYIDGKIILEALVFLALLVEELSTGVNLLKGVDFFCKLAIIERGLHEF